MRANGHTRPMAASPHPTPRVPPRRVLEDASGRRLRRMRWVGRATALLFLAWLALVILGGLGVGPVGRLPLGHVLRPSAGPPPLRQLPKPAAPSAADLVPALPAPAPTPRPATRTTSVTHGKSAVAPGQTKTTTTATTASPGRSGSAPGHTATTPAHGKSPTAPGHVKKTATTTTTTTTVATVPGKALGHGKKP
jgi:hypothetical protein